MIFSSVYAGLLAAPRDGVAQSGAYRTLVERLRAHRPVDALVEVRESPESTCWKTSEA